MKIKKMFNSFIALIFFLLLSVTPATHAADSRKAIVIPTHNWPSQVVMAYVIGGIFESMDENVEVEYVSADSQAVYEAIRQGEVTISHEVWEDTFGKAFYRAMQQGGLIDAGTHTAVSREELGVPNWVIEEGLCPGLPNWKALTEPHYAKHFVTPDSGEKGRILDGPQSWQENLFPERIKALGLGDLWTVKFAGRADALWAELAAAKKAGRGTIIFNWSPNFTDATGFTFIEFPPYTKACEEDPESETYRKCGSKIGWLKKAAYYKFPKTHPNAYTAFTKISFTTEQIGQMAALVTVDKMTHKDAAKKWLADNKGVWEPWTKE